MRVLITVLLLLALPVAAAAGPEADPSGAATWPIAAVPEVVRPFDPPARRWLAGHRGADLRADPGGTVRAPIGGIVEVAGVIVDRGVVVIRDGDMQVSLEPVVAAVAVGQQVAVGDVVGTIGGGPSHCAPAVCLHWGLRVRGVYHDPLLLVLRYRAVLLP